MDIDHSDDNVSELGNEVPHEQDDDVESVQSRSSQGRGRPRIPEQWTRLISFRNDDLNLDHCHPLGMDLLVAQNLPR